MTTFVEGDLEITFNNVIVARKFDDEYRLRHCMKAVDFIIEREDRYIFVEIKNPQQSPNPDVDSYVTRFKRREIDSDLKYKFRDSFIYEWASGRANKPIDYLVLIAIDALEPAVLIQRSEQLQLQIPTGVPKNSSWERQIARSCIVYNISTWNRTWTDFPIRRINPNSSH